MDNNKYLFLITGAAGSGKSTLAQLLENIARRYIDPISEICEADEYWYILGKGKYAFNPKLLWKAHKWCQDNAREVMSHGANLIVSNTNIRRDAHRRNQVHNASIRGSRDSIRKAIREHELMAGILKEKGLSERPTTGDIAAMYGAFIDKFYVCFGL